MGRQGGASWRAGGSRLLLGCKVVWVVVSSPSCGCMLGTEEMWRHRRPLLGLFRLVVRKAIG